MTACIYVEMFIVCSLSVISPIDNDYGYGKRSEFFGDHPISIAMFFVLLKLVQLKRLSIKIRRIMYV